MSLYHTLRHVNVADEKEAQIVDAAIVKTAEAKEIIETIKQYSDGLVTFAEMMNKLVYIDVICADNPTPDTRQSL